MIIRNIDKTFIFCLFISFLTLKVFSLDSHRKLLTSLEQNYPVEILFEQIYKNDVTSGWMIISGRGKARTEFSPPNNNIIVADGKWIIFHDPEIDRTTYIPLDSGIFGAFLNPKAFKENKKFKVLEKSDNDLIIFYIEFNINESLQKLEISFLKETKNLVGWKLYESQNDFIKVNVINLKKLNYSEITNKNFFKLPKALINSGNIYLGPYKDRNVKKKPSGGRSNN